MDERLKEAIERKNALPQLIASEGWKIVAEVLTDRANELTNAIVLTPLATMDEALQQEYKKGAAAEILRALALPQSLLEDAGEVISALQEKPDGEEEEIGSE